MFGGVEHICAVVDPATQGTVRSYHTGDRENRAGLSACEAVLVEQICSVMCLHWLAMMMNAKSVATAEMSVKGPA